MFATADIAATILVGITVAFVLWIGKSERNWIKKILNWFPAILFAYVIPAAFTHAFHWDLSEVYLHGLSRYWIIPITLLAVMSALPLRKLALVGVRPLVLFVGGSMLIAILPVLLVKAAGWFLPETAELFYTQAYWKGLVPIVGGWIGGSTSQLILKELAATPENIFLSVLVLDNILVNIWTILMFQMIQKAGAFSRWLGIRDEVPVAFEVEKEKEEAKIPPAVVSLVFFFATAIFFAINPRFIELVVAMSLIGMMLGNLLSAWNTAFSLRLGSICIVLVMAILGLRLDFANLVLPAPFVWLVLIWLLLHFVGMILIAKTMRLNLVWVPVASMANLGGISTAPAVTAAFRKDLMPHAVLLAILSMVTGTAWGMLTIYLFTLL